MLLSMAVGRLCRGVVEGDGVGRGVGDGGVLRAKEEGRGNAAEASEVVHGKRI